MEKTSLIGGAVAVVIIGFFFWLSSLIVIEIDSQSTPLTPVTETTAPVGKIDPRVACESALVYTTFENGEQADAFVAECIDGKYPEVINRYIESMELDGATI